MKKFLKEAKNWVVVHKNGFVITVVSTVIGVGTILLVKALGGEKEPNLITTFEPEESGKENEDIWHFETLEEAVEKAKELEGRQVAIYAEGLDNREYCVMDL